MMSSSRQVSNLGSIDDEWGHVTEEQMEWKVIFMSQVWQLAIVPSLRYCAARSWVHINTHTGGSGQLVAGFHPLCNPLIDKNKKKQNI